MTLSAIQALVLVQLFGSILGNDEKTDNYFLVPFLCTIITEHPQTPRRLFFTHYVQFFVNGYTLREGNNPCRNLFLPPLPPLALFPLPSPSSHPSHIHFPLRMCKCWTSSIPILSPCPCHPVHTIRCAMPSLSPPHYPHSSFPPLTKPYLPTLIHLFPSLSPLIHAPTILISHSLLPLTQLLSPTHSSLSTPVNLSRRFLSPACESCGCQKAKRAVSSVFQLTFAYLQNRYILFSLPSLSHLVFSARHVSSFVPFSFVDSFPSVLST